MRSLDRNLNPADFPEKFTGAQRVTWELELLQAKREVQRDDDLDKIDFKGKGSRWKTAKENLLRESNNKCAYCEVNFTSVAYGDVEHYRPKSVYWWLAYSYHNYAPSCQLCNQKYKKAAFPFLLQKLPAPRVRKNSTDTFLQNLAGNLSVDPLDDNAGMPFADFRQAHEDERPLSLDPYLDDPTQFIAYENNDLTREVILVSRGQPEKELVDSAIDLFGLNRKELRDRRYKCLLSYRVMRKFRDNEADPVVQQGLDALIQQLHRDDTAEFSGMIRYFESQPLIDPPGVV